MKAFFTKNGITWLVVFGLLLSLLFSCEEQEEPWVELHILNNSGSSINILIEQEINKSPAEGGTTYPTRTYTGVKSGDSIRYEGGGGYTRFKITDSESVDFFHPKKIGASAEWPYDLLYREVSFSFDGTKIIQVGKEGI